MKSITLNAIRRQHPCKDGWQKLLSNLGKTKPDDEPITLLTVLESNGLDDAIWCLRALPDTELKNIQIFALRAANTVRHLMIDQRSIAALDVTQKYLDGDATIDEVREAAAYASSSAAYAAARATAYAARAADATAYAARAADAAVYAARAADAAANDKITEIFKEIFC